ncbi:unnamed protein product [Cuscuta epithymum]|uniref:CCHC-type domain-containing protein n=1 Tax=Cuscuta epithymum TaxID=186058 RepID=A0AAV0CB46_9ASTE|nr:unnamed protein product [Cuscuta epithymum]
MMDMISRNVNMLSIAEEENRGLVLAADPIENMGGINEGFNLAVVARVVSDKPVRAVSFCQSMAMVWRPVRGVSIDEIEDSKFLLQFYHEGDLNRVVDEGPWSFEQNLVVIKRLGRTDKPLEVALDHADFWVQVHDLPLSYMTARAARGIANSIGSFVQLDESSPGGKKRLFMRISVTLNVTMALTQRLQVRQEGNNWTWANFWYERLPNFCFLCGILGHADRFCPSNPHSGIGIGEKPYGPWLRADMRRGGVHPGNRWLIPSNNRPCVRQEEREETEQGTKDHGSYLVQGLLSKGKEIATMGDASRKRRITEKDNEVGIQASMEVDEESSKNLEVAVLDVQHRQ